MAAATIGSSLNTLAHEPTCRFVVRQMEPFRYRCEATWNSAAAASAASRRYPTSSSYAERGIARRYRPPSHFG